MYYVCLSVTGLRLKYTGSRIVYVPLCHVTLMMQSRAMELEVKDSEDRSRHQKESRDMEDG